ncbi:MAG: hypothetical protein QOH76_4132, partial [Thermoleophilaceae bacterium]|nr:hypothetical protein [Thermoleophilaceae bacterium]
MEILAVDSDKRSRAGSGIRRCYGHLVELGLYTFAEVHPAPGERWEEAAARRFDELMEEAALADRLGLQVFGVGEHHRPDFAV